MEHKNKFLEKYIIPTYLGLVHSDCLFSLQDLNETIILASNKYAKIIGFKNFIEAYLKKPDIDYKRLYGDAYHYELQKKFLIKHKKPLDYLHTSNTDNIIHLCSIEPILDSNGDVIAKKEISRPINLLSHREIIERYFKKHPSQTLISANIVDTINLTEKEEIILFMLISGYSQDEIAHFLHCSRSQIAKIVVKNLCFKFGITALSTKGLIEKAITMGYSMMIPNSILATLNLNII